MFQFEGYTLDVARHSLRAVDREVALRRKSFELLRYLVENPDRLVTKEELLKAIWPDAVVSDESLTQCLREVRQAIGDSKQTIIATVPRCGYRFAAPVLRVAANAVAVPPSSVDPSPLVGGAIAYGKAGSPPFPLGGESGGSEAPVAAAPIQQPGPALSLPDRPSIAVLPFTDLTGDPEQDYFADGIVEEIITALSRLRWLFVISHNSSFTYKGRSVDVRQVGRELGVRYVLEGSVRKALNHVRITGQLIDASTGAHIWADRFDGAMEDIFDLQDQVTASVVGAIVPEMEQAEIERASRKPTENLDAYDYYLRGMAKVYQATRHANGDALRLFYKAIELDPNFAPAHGMAAWCYTSRKMNGWMADRAKEIAETARLARQAVELGKKEAVALTMGGFALAFVMGEVEDGAAFLDQALILNPNLAAGWVLSGVVNGWLGRPEVEIERATRAVRLSPLDPLTPLAFTIIGAGHLLVGRYDEASSWAEKGLWQQPNYAGAARVAAASHALAGRLDQAQKAAAQVRQIDPTFRVSDFGRMFPFRRPEDIERYEEGLRKAGLPE
jgi:TolB-like protein/DNA-binding winged helix-turn-helix (wHTH) protein/tetratricopeptide (TPR) repeat protein